MGNQFGIPPSYFQDKMELYLIGLWVMPMGDPIFSWTQNQIPMVTSRGVKEPNRGELSYIRDLFGKA